MISALILGLVVGSVYAIAALGLTLTYKTSGIFNFGHGAIGAASAYLFFDLHFSRGMPWPLAALLTVVVFGIVVGIAFERLAARLTTVPLTLKIVGTLGVLLAVQGLLYVVYGTEARLNPDFLPAKALTFGDVVITTSQIILVTLGLAAVSGLSLYFRYSTTGQRMRAVVDDPDLLAETGVDPVKVRRRAWVIGSVFASASGVLIAPNVGLDAAGITLLVVFSFGASAIGLFRSLPLTYAGGLLLGILSSVSDKYIATSSEALRALPSNLSFIVLFAVLVFLGSRLKDVGQPVRTRPSRELPARVRYIGGSVGLVVLLLIPAVAGSRIVLFQLALAYVLVFLSLGLLVKTSGQISLSQMAFAAIGASTSALLVGKGVPWLPAVALACLVAVPVGAFLALPAIRLSGIYLALATLGFGITLNRVVYNQDFMFGASGSLDFPRPSFAESDTAYYYLCLAFVLAGLVVVLGVQRGQLGRLLRALADSPTALITHGASTSVTRVLVFCLSAFLAALGGALTGPITGFANSLEFGYFVSLLLLPVLVLSGGGAVVSPFLASFLLIVLPGYIDSEQFVLYQPVLFGVSAIALVFLYQSEAAERLVGAALTRSAPRARRPLAVSGQRRPVTREAPSRVLVRS